ncbi:hypothetical protein FHS83_000272 [Rhizomicrobium palustre]|uniref:DUF2147 domain-containing protein n=1 Tax=Rhizomicrobium palustre TaxID=189966 RepID=A0A846MU40_9PROT|nr:hypothetical protein [Rhizomicrobium palustre]NIK86954.1 hypothetical protein [Rhizomicrobium palustre]
MKRILTAALLALSALAFPAMAEETPAPGVITCWYNDNGKLTGVTPASTSEHVNYLYNTGRGGDQAWAYAVHGAKTEDCPARRPPVR